MNTSKSVHLTATIPRFVHNFVPRFPRRRLIAACALLPLCLVLLLMVRQADPITDLETAKAKWAATGITDYRIEVAFKRPYSICQQDFEVRGTTVGYKHKDTCGVGPAVTRPTANWPTVNNLFSRIEDAEKNPACGPNGCVCDGPVEVTAEYDPERGYPKQITYTLRQDLRNRDPQYWLAMLNGSLAQCPQVNYLGQTISVTSLEELPPLADQLSEATPEVGVGKPDKPNAPETSIEGAIKPEVTPVH